MTINAGAIPPDHWTQDIYVGGGRIIGEACHFIDLLRHIVGEEVLNYKINSMDAEKKDTVTIELSFIDGSIGTIHYFSNGSRSFPKERLEVFTSGRILTLDNFKKLSGYGWKHFNTMKLWQQDKGQQKCVEKFLKAISNNEKSPIPIEEIIEATRITIDLADS